MKNFKLSIIAVLAVFAFSYAGFAQNIENTGTINNVAAGTIIMNCDASQIDNQGTGTITNAGTINFTGTQPVFDNDGTFVNAPSGTNGTLEFSGGLTTNSAAAFTGANAIASDHDNRPEGYVLFSSTDDQNILEGFYTDVYLAGNSVKTYADGASYNVAGDYVVANGGTTTMGTRSLDNSGNRDYGTSTFIYDGLGDQVVFAEDGTAGGDAYYNLTLTNTYGTPAGTLTGTKSIEGAVVVQNAFLHDADELAGTDGLVVTAAGSLTLGTADGAAPTASFNTDANIAGTLTQAFGPVVFGDGTNAMTATIANGGTVNFNAGDIATESATISANATLALEAQGSSLNLAAASGLSVESSGGLTNAAGDGDNTVFAATSRVTYTGAGNQVLATSTGSPYGELVLESSALMGSLANGAGSNANDINVLTSFSLDENNLDLTASGGVLVIQTPAENNVLYPSATGDVVEVDGPMKRIIGTTEDLDLVYNNAETIVTVTTLADDLTDLTLDSRPATGWQGYSNTLDVNRVIGFDYTETGTNGWVLAMQFGYQNGEVPVGLDESKLKFKRETGATTLDKIATGNATTQLDDPNGNGFDYVSLAGLRSENGTYVNTPKELVPNGADLFLRGGPTTFVSVRPGRWSNPATWDEGMEPTSEDIVEIYHTVHAGFIRSTDGWGDIGTEASEASPGALAAQITVKAPGAAVDNLDKPSLLFGTSDLADAPNGFSGWGVLDDYTTGIPFPGYLIIEAGVGTTYDTVDLSAEEDDDLYNNGLILFPDAGQTNSLTIEGWLQNAAEVQNAGTIQICQ